MDEIKMDKYKQQVFLFVFKNMFERPLSNF